MSMMSRSGHWLNALWRFSRPHTIIGTSLSVLGLAIIALSVVHPGVINLWVHDSSIAPITVSWGQWLELSIGAWLTCLCGNVYIVGLNQLQDIQIDRINKPTLPLAAGDFSLAEGIGIVTITGAVAVVGAGLQGLFLFWTVFLSVLIGTAYSQPPIRLKRFPFWAALCIFGVRGVIVNLGLFLHFQQRLGGTAGIPPEIWTLTVFIVVFTFAIAIFKDMPDTEGDRKFHIRTLTLQLGKQAVFNLSRWVLTGCYVGMVAIAWFIPSVQPMFMVLTHLGLLYILWTQSLKVDLSNKAKIARFYQLIWKLFFLEYLIFPAACLLGP